MSVTEKYSYHFCGDLLVEVQWHVNQNKMAAGFLKEVPLHAPIT